MHFAQAIAACVLLGTASSASVYVPVHKRNTYDALINDFSYLGMLAKRDSCSDAFGSTAHNSICAPDFTLCCTRDRQSYPSCEKWLGKGWCCVGEGDNDKCYVDQASVCNQDGSVECTRLKSGAKKACCPKMTTCDPNTDAYEQAVRCNINRGDLIEAAKSAEAKTASTSAATASSSSTTAPTSTTASAAQTTAPESQAASPTGSTDDESTGISGGAIGGIVVGALAGLGLIAGLVWFFMRRSKKAKSEAAGQTPDPQPSIPQYYDDQQAKYQQQQQQGYWPQASPDQSAYTYSPPPSELMTNNPPVELDSGYHQQMQQQPQPQHSPQPQQYQPVQQQQH